VTRTSAATIASIAERIESRLAAMAGLEAAIREDLALLAFVDDPHPANALLTIEQASERLHVSRATMFRLMTDDPDLRYLKINKRTLFRPEDIEEDWFKGLNLLHVPAYSLFAEPIASTTRRAVEIARADGAIVSVDLSSAAGIREYGGARLALDLAMLHPEIVFANEAEAAELGAPLVPFLELAIESYDPAECAQCVAGLALTEPGSRFLR